MQPVANNIWLLRYPQSLFGTQIGRHVTIIRLNSGDLVIHSTAPFSPADVAAIRALGRPAWLLDATLFHDTFAAAGPAAFPDVPYAAPEGFRAGGGPIHSLGAPPAAWAGELDALPIDGMPGVREFAFYHRPSRTLIVADLVFNFGPNATAWTRWFFRHAGGIRQFPGMSRLFRSSIRDRAAFAVSVGRLMEKVFDRLIVGHGDTITSGAKQQLGAAMAAAGF